MPCPKCQSPRTEIYGIERSGDTPPTDRHEYHASAGERLSLVRQCIACGHGWPYNPPAPIDASEA